MKISPLLFLFVALFVSLGFGQKTEANYGRTLPENLFKNGRNEQKLPKQIRSVFQDKSGNYWFGTNGAGIYCYDSKTLRQYTVDDGLADNQCLSIQEDRLGNIWVESGNFSISKFDGAKFSTIVKKENSSFNIDSIWKSQIDELWFYGGNGVFRSNGTAMEYSPFETTGLSNNANAPFSLSSSSVYSLLKDKKDQVWFGTQAEGVCMFDGKKLSWFKEKGLAGPAVLAIFEDSKGNMWFGNNGAGVFLFDGSKIKNITQEAAVLGTKKNALDITERKSLTRVYSINEDLFGNIWIGTVDTGVWKYDGSSFTNYTTQDGLTSNAINTIYRDRAGELWFGTDSHGICKFNGNSFYEFVMQ
jgi:ligand-binding sensor domain-containing protein